MTKRKFTQIKKDIRKYHPARNAFTVGIPDNNGATQLHT